MMRLVALVTRPNQARKKAVHGLLFWLIITARYEY
jgi:hypothetical protein